MSVGRCGSRATTSTSSSPRSMPAALRSSSSARGSMSSFESSSGSAFLAARVRQIAVLPMALAISTVWPLRAEAQQQPQGFAVERFYPSAAGGGWFVMDDLNIDGGFGGAVALTTGYARRPLEIASPGGPGRLTLVSEE